MKIFSSLEKIAVFLVRDIMEIVSPPLCTRFMAAYYRRSGMRILGMPNYVSSKVYFDGTDYSMIELNEGCTISSHVKILTHDWSLYTAARALGMCFESPVGILRPVRVGRYAFVGMGSILLPGADIGDGAIVGAGSVVRGKVDDYTIVMGNPATKAGMTRDFVTRKLAKTRDDSDGNGRVIGSTL